MGIQIGSNKGAGPIRGKIMKSLINIQKSSSHEPLARMHWYLVWIIWERTCKFVKMKSLGACMAWPQRLKLLYSEIIKKSSSQELLHQMGQYLAWIIPRKRRFKFVQIKFLGVINGHALRGHIFT